MFKTKLQQRMHKAPITPLTELNTENILLITSSFFLIQQKQHNMMLKKLTFIHME